MNKTVLQLTDISFDYKTTKADTSNPILRNFNLTMLDGEFISIIGPSGSGKSTLFRLITGLEQPTTGDVLINGINYQNRFGRVGYMPQEDLLMPWRTVLDNATLPLEIKGVNKKEAYQKVNYLLDEFGLKGYANSYPSELSGGMKQRVSFLRSVLNGSELLLLDEPFSALDAITKLSMQEWLLKQWQALNKTILFITHDVNEALFLSDRILLITNSEKQVEEFNVPLSRPRNLRDLNKQTVIELKDQLIDQLRGR
ncbi:ABC transporter ATP-binding protein [Aquibacillus rhizosphaerae]|uniref:ABC transporter ATP-binding protein n=1 Tax=Aquibacillus rhizosphaerae TaxID=3051431 RepID=A0ABT7L1B1_9BACI|nr:ABC transporter ATP-binding protein [Aquibacillus sp. LR5S19]MDL4839626.1 ABC transporter ATP-binding protein [Aquibacillus sp. LR5S19]